MKSSLPSYIGGATANKPTKLGFLNVEPLRESGFDLALNHPRHAKVSLPTPKKIIGTVRRIKDTSEAILRELEETLSALTKIVAPRYHCTIC